MKSIQYLLIFSFLFTFLSAQSLKAQEFLPQESFKNTERTNLGELEYAFMQWAKDKELSTTKGWKWYARWLDEQMKRSSIKGELPHHLPLFEAATMIAEQKKRMVESRNGANWMPIGPSVYPDVGRNPIFEGLGRINTVAFHPTDPNTIWVGVAQGGMWKTTNSGQSWIPLTDDLPITRISDIAIDPSDPDVMYISVGDYAYLGIALELDERKRHTHYGLGVYKTEDGGQNWKPTGLTFDQTEKDASLTRRVFVHDNKPDHLVAAGIHGMWRSNDGGENWTKTLDHKMMDLEKDPQNPNVLYASSGFIRNLNQGYAAIWKSENFGDNWVELPSTIPAKDSLQRIELAISPSNPDYVYAIAARPNGGLYAFYRSVNAGKSWEQRAKSPNILHWYTGTSNGGQGNYDLGIMVHPENPDLVYAGGINLWGSEDGGKTWKWATYWLPTFGKSVHADQHFYAYNPLDKYFYICHDGGIARTQKIFLHTVDEIMTTSDFKWKTEWEHIASGMQITSFYRMGFSPVNEERFIAGAQDNSTMVRKENGWHNLMLGDGMECFFHPENEDVFFCSSQFGRLARSDDGGESLVDTLANPIRREEFGEWTTPYMPSPHDINTIYTAYGNVWKSKNLGGNWEKITDLPIDPEVGFLPEASTMSVASSDENMIYLGKRIRPTFGIKGTFWRTTDGGNTVENITAGLPDSLYFTSSTVSDENSKKVWVSVGGFADGVKVFRSDDGGDSWKNISYDLPNVPVNSIRHQPGSEDNLIYIGTDVGVFYTHDQMNTWELYSDGLPNVIVSDLDISVGRNKIYAATFGRGLWAGDLVNTDPSAVELLDKASISLYPNPNMGVFKLEIRRFPIPTVKIEIVDILGRKLHKEELILSGGQFTKEYKFDLLPGLYFMRISNGKNGKVIRFQVAN